MKRAWEIKKENAENIFAECLKMAWTEAKATKFERVIEASMESRKKLSDAGFSFLYFDNNFVIVKMDFVAGTEKQISYANSIAFKLVNNCEDHIRRAIDAGKLKKENGLSELVKFITELEKFNNAGEFINKFKTKVC